MQQSLQMILEYHLTTIIRGVNSNPLYSAQSMEHNHYILGSVGGHRGQVKREIHEPKINLLQYLTQIVCFNYLSIAKLTQTLLSEIANTDCLI